jgi:hypothetical protein
MPRLAALTFAGLVVLLVPAHAIGAAPSAPSPSPSPVTLHRFAQQLGRATPAASVVGVTLAQPYSWWSWPSGDAYDDTSENISIQSSTTPGQPYFWSYQFHSQFGDGGYVGLQDASVPSGKKIALFSVWQADAAQGTSCNEFSGEGSGESCRIDPYNWTTNRVYTLTVRVTSSDSTGAWYEASVTDTVTDTTSTIGSIHVPAGWGGIYGVVSWTEYFGGTADTCSDLPKARARFDFPTASLGTVQITNDVHVIGTGNCPSHITGYTGGDLQIAPK